MPFENERRIPLTEAAKMIPSAMKPGRPVTTQTLRRWAKDGVRGVRLETAWIGAWIMTSEEAVRRFLAALNPTAA